MSVLCLNMCAKYCNSSTFACLLGTASKFALFSVPGLKEEKLIKKQTYMKTETCKNLIPEYFEYFCQMTSKSILSCTVSKLVHFLRHCLVINFTTAPLCIPSDWKDGIIVTLYKGKGPKTCLLYTSPSPRD